MASKVTIKIAKITKLFDDLKKASNLVVEVGVFDPERAEIALVHEYGSRTVPARSFLRSTFERPGVIKRVTNVMQEIVDNVANGSSFADQLVALGELGASEVRDSINNRNVKGPPLQPATIARKGHDKKLYDTGKLRDSVTYRVKSGRVGKTKGIVL